MHNTYYIDSLRAKRQQILQLAEKYGARNLRIFGSVARGEAKPTSDLDMLVDMEAKRSLLDHIALKQDLEDFLGVTVDLVSERALRGPIRDKILEGAITL